MEYEWKTKSPEVFNELLQNLPVQPLQARLTFVSDTGIADECIVKGIGLSAVAELEYDADVGLFLPVARDSTPLLSFCPDDTAAEREAAQHMFLLSANKAVFHVHVSGNEERGTFLGFQHNELLLLLGAGYRPKAGIITFDTPFDREVIYYEQGDEAVLLLDLGRRSNDEAAEKLKEWFSDIQGRYV